MCLQVLGAKKAADTKAVRRLSALGLEDGEVWITRQTTDIRKVRGCPSLSAANLGERRDGLARVRELEMRPRIATPAPPPQGFAWAQSYIHKSLQAVCSGAKARRVGDGWELAVQLTWEAAHSWDRRAPAFLGPERWSIASSKP